MLVVKIFANEHQIDEVHIHNTGRPYTGDATSDTFWYEIRKPEGTFYPLVHCRKEGWLPLVRQALNLIYDKQKAATALQPPLHEDSPRQAEGAEKG